MSNENSQKFKIGCHLSASKGFLNMGKEIVALGGNTFQFFTRNPRGGAAPAGGLYRPQAGFQGVSGAGAGDYGAGVSGIPHEAFGGGTAGKMDPGRQRIRVGVPTYSEKIRREAYAMVL